MRRAGRASVICAGIVGLGVGLVAPRPVAGQFPGGGGPPGGRGGFGGPAVGGGLGPGFGSGGIGNGFGAGGSRGGGLGSGKGAATVPAPIGLAWTGRVIRRHAGPRESWQEGAGLGAGGGGRSEVNLAGPGRGGNIGRGFRSIGIGPRFRDAGE